MNVFFFLVSCLLLVCRVSLFHTCNEKFISLRLTGEALTQSSLLEADGENADSMVTMTTAVEPMNLHHAMLRSPGRCMHTRLANTMQAQLTTRTHIRHDARSLV